MANSQRRRLIYKLSILGLFSLCLVLFSSAATRPYFLAPFGDRRPSAVAAQQKTPARQAVPQGEQPAASPQDKATAIQVGVMTEKQKEHSKLFKQYQSGKKLDAIPAQEFAPGVEPGVYIEPGTPVLSSNVVVNFDDFLRELNCDADAVVAVTVNDQAAQLTESKEFTFTDYTAEVREIYKNNPAAPLTQHSAITVTRPGGRVEINGRVVGAIDSSFKLLQQGKQYLLFLKYLPNTNSYKSIRQGSFLIDGDKLSAMTEEVLPWGNGALTLNDAVRNALFVNCHKK